MRLLLVVVGRARAGAMASLIDDYEARAARYWSLDVREVREEPARARTPASVRDREGERLLASAGSARVVACDASGELLTSEQLAAWLGRERDHSAHDVAFLVGGAFGLSPAVRARAERTLALSRFTLPHELARLVLTEQLYRAGTIVRGEPYHK